MVRIKRNSILHINTSTYLSDDGTNVIQIANELIPIGDNFRLLLSCELPLDSVDTELLTRCQLINFELTDEALAETFKLLIFENEKGEAHHKHVSVRSTLCDLEASLQEEDAKVLDKLCGQEGKILDNKGSVCQDLLAIDETISQLRSRKIGLSDLEAELRAEGESYIQAAHHIKTLFHAVGRLRAVHPTYDFSLQWFLKVLRSSVENSNKSRNVEKRLRLIQDHFTYNLYRYVCFSLAEPDRLLFAFYITCSVLVARGELGEDEVDLLFHLEGVAGQRREAKEIDLEDLTSCQRDFFTRFEDTCYRAKGKKNASASTLIRQRASYLAYLK